MIKLAAVFLVLLLVPMQLFGLASRLTRMDAGILPFDPELYARLTKRMQIVSYVLITLLTLATIISIHI